MKNKRPYIIAILSILSVIVLYFMYRVYHAIQLNLRLEAFVAEQTKSIQDNYSERDHLPKNDGYFIQRSEGFLIDIGKGTIGGHYDSYWISYNSHQQQVTESDYNKEVAKYTDGTLVWDYMIQPLSGSVVCIMLEAHKPRSWTPNGTGSGGFYGTYTVDTSKSNLQLEPLEPSDSSCTFSNFDFTDLIQRSLLSVH